MFVLPVIISNFALHRLLAGCKFIGFATNVSELVFFSNLGFFIIDSKTFWKGLLVGTGASLSMLSATSLPFLDDFTCSEDRSST